MLSLKTLALFFIFTLPLMGCNADMFVSQTPNMAEFLGKSPENIYYQANHALKERKYSTAISRFRALIKLYPDSTKAELAHLALIECYQARGQAKETIHEIAIFLATYRNSVHCDSLIKRKEMLCKKQKRDRLYHSLWLKDIKDKNGKQYNKLAKHIKGLEGNDTLDSD